MVAVMGPSGSGKSTLPLIAAIAGWLLAGREPPLIARQPIE
jgi:ABC-type lipoprotein export system ATPase subunit